MTGRALIFVLLAVASAASAQDSAVLEVAGIGVEGKPAYRGGGAVRFESVTLGAQVLHWTGEGDLSLPLSIAYEVLEAAPIVLSTRLGSEYWRLYHMADETISYIYTRERIDLSAPGPAVTEPEGQRAWFSERRGPAPATGVVGIRSHYYFLVEPADGGAYLDVTGPPALFNEPALARALTFTLADLGTYSLSISDLQTTWQAEGPLRLKLLVTDAAGQSFPVLHAPVVVSAGNWEAPLEAEWGLMNVPTGYLRATLPDDLPEQIEVAGTVTLQTPEGPAEETVAATFQRGEGLVSAEEMRLAALDYELPRNADGVVRETRAIWLHTGHFDTPEAVANLIERCTEARLNVLVPIVMIRNTLSARSELMPRLEEGAADPLAMLIEAAHAAGLEVHPWFCTTYRDAAFRQWFEEKFGVNVDVVKADGSIAGSPADAHRPEYRDFMVDLMVGIARDYEVDGIHHDYIRIMEQCHCDKCLAEFEAQFGVPLTEATEEQRIAWHRQAIGDIVERTAEGVREVRPEAIISAAVFSSLKSGALQGQDPAEWARQGWVDLVTPMDYAMQSLQVKSNERQFLDALDDDDMLVTGLSLYQRSGSVASSRPPELVREQIELVRSMGIHGYCLFAFGNFSDEQLAILRDEVNAEPAVPWYR